MLPNYRAWVVVARSPCAWQPGSSSNAPAWGRCCAPGTENPRLVEAFGVNVPRMITLTYGFGVALYGFAGVLAAPLLRFPR